MVDNEPIDKVNDYATRIGLSHSQNLLWIGAARMSLGSSVDVRISLPVSSLLEGCRWGLQTSVEKVSDSGCF